MSPLATVDEADGTLFWQPDDAPESWLPTERSSRGIVASGSSTGTARATRQQRQGENDERALQQLSSIHQPQRNLIAKQAQTPSKSTLSKAISYALKNHHRD